MFVKTLAAMMTAGSNALYTSRRVYDVYIAFA